MGTAYDRHNHTTPDMGQKRLDGPSQGQGQHVVSERIGSGDAHRLPSRQREKMASLRTMFHFQYAA